MTAISAAARRAFRELAGAPEVDVLAFMFKLAETLDGDADIRACNDAIDRIAELGFRGAKTLAPKLEEHRDIAFLSRELATCSTEAPMPFDVAGLARRAVDADAAASLAQELGLDSIARAARVL